MLFKNNFGLLYIDEEEYRIKGIKEYIKKETPKDIIRIATSYSHDSGVTLIGKYVHKIMINVNARKVIFLDDIYTFLENRYSLKVDDFFQDQNLPDIYFSVSRLPPLKHKKLFFGLNTINETIKMLSYKDDVFDDKRAKFNTFIAYAVLFFLDQIHEYFLGLLKTRESIRIDMPKLDFTLKGILEIDYRWTDISQNTFKTVTYVHKSEKDKDSVEYILKRFVKKYLTYLAINTGKKINPDLYKRISIEPEIDEGINEVLLLYYIAVHAFYVYILAYIYTFIDLQKIFNDLAYPRFLTLLVSLSEDDGICFKYPYLRYECITAQLSKDSLITKTLLGEYDTKLYEKASFFGFTVDEEWKELSLDGMYKENRKKIQNNVVNMFFITYKYTTPYVYFSYNVESFMFFFRKIVEGNTSLDLFYRFVYRIMQLGQN